MICPHCKEEIEHVEVDTLATFAVYLDTLEWDLHHPLEGAAKVIICPECGEDLDVDI